MRTCLLLLLLLSYSFFSSAQLKLVKQISPGPRPSYPNVVGGLSNGSVLLFADDGFTAANRIKELWISDGTELGTTLVKNIYKGMGGSVGNMASIMHNNELYFFADEGNFSFDECLYVSDGLFAGTRKVMPPRMQHGSFVGYSVNSYNGKMYFTAYDSLYGLELFKTDGTLAGTEVLDIFPGPSGSEPSMVYPAFGKILFYATDGTHGYELYISDGTVQGTKMIEDLNPGNENGIHGSLLGCMLNGVYYFAGISSADKEIDLCATNGDSIWVVKDITGAKVSSTNSSINFVAAGNKVFFKIHTTDHGNELWATDGTTQGTSMVKDITPGPTGSVFSLEGELNGKLLFTAETKALGLELWISDGSENGTHIVKDICPGGCVGKAVARSEKDYQSYRRPVCPMIHNNKYYFGGHDGSGDGTQLWVTDGTDTGTKKIPSMLPNPGIPLGPAMEWITIIRDRIWMSYAHGDGDYELYIYDIPVPNDVNNVAYERSFALYPNPGNGTFEIKLDNNSYMHGSMYVMDMTGRVLYSQGVISGTRNIQVTLPEVATGFYNVVVQLDGDIISQRLMVQ